MIKFFGAQNRYGYFSNFYPSEFEYLGKKFYSVEHFFMYEKASLFGDTNIQSLLSKFTSNEPKKFKELGRMVKGYNDKIWSEKRFDIMKKGLYLKFNQNIELKSLLLSTGDRILVEASPYDKIWGVGLNWYDVRINDPKLWKGLNLLGKALMEVRDTLKNIEE